MNSNYTDKFHWSTFWLKVNVNTKTKQTFFTDFCNSKVYKKKTFLY